MVKPTSQTDITERSSSEAMGVLDRIKRILSPFKRDRWLAVAVYGSLTTLGLAVGTLAWNWSDLQTNPSEQSKKRFDASLSAVSTGATIVAGIVLFLNFTVANRNAEIAQKKLDEDIKKAERDEKLAQSRLKMERFNKAVEMLGKNDSIHLRLGGIYALESIAADSDKDAPDETYRLVLEVLTAFVRENAPYPPKKPEKQENQPQTTEQPTEAGEETAAELPPLPTDIQAVLTVLKRRKHKDKDWEQYPLDLMKTDLRRAALFGANLQKSDLFGANLQQAYLREVNLQKAYLWEANLQKSDLFGANLQQAYLRDANLQQAVLRAANLQQADLFGANLQEANLESANLQQANFKDANLQESYLRDANLQEAYLKRANLQQAVLVEASLQKANLESANLQEANLESANLQEATLRRANLQEATLRRANLQETNLRGVNLQQACLSETNLRGSRFWDSRLTETALAEAKEKARANLQSAQNWETAQYDPEIREWLGLPPENSSVE